MTGQRIGYRRVSSVDQNTERQLNSMEFDAEFEDKVSGKDRNRPALMDAVKHCRKGDVLVVHSMDRLARNLSDLLALVKELTDKGVTVEFVKEHLIFTSERNDAMATLMLQIMGACAEFERSMIRERQREGIAIAKAKGKFKGRKRALSPGQLVALRWRFENKESVTDLAEEFGVSRQTVYTAVKEA